MNKFRVKKPVSEIKKDKATDAERFIEAGESHDIQHLAPTKKEEKPSKSFTIPLNNFELDLLRKSAKKDNRSQRYIARLLLVEAMQKYLESGEG
ncbi:hypothetical protein OAP56_05005 [Rickettsiaceae bacterium]|nr:hypothetical protein [Rickettsiaceae bacterium]